jgi:hypothetical protein
LKGCAATSNTENGRVRLPWEEMMMVDDATPEKLWQRFAEESPHTSDDEIERIFIAAAKAKQDFIRQITE